MTTCFVKYSPIGVKVHANVLLGYHQEGRPCLVVSQNNTPYYFRQIDPTEVAEQV